MFIKKMQINTFTKVQNLITKIISSKFKLIQFLKV